MRRIINPIWYFRSGTSSNASTPSAKKLDEKPSTPISKPVTPTSGASGAGTAGAPLKAAVKPPALQYPYLGNGAHDAYGLAGYSARAALAYEPLRPPIGPAALAPIPGGKPWVSSSNLIRMYRLKPQSLFRTLLSLVIPGYKKQKFAAFTFRVIFLKSNVNKTLLTPAHHSSTLD